jgi:hypothetical protein
MDVPENHVLQQNMAKIKQGHEELDVAESGNMEKEINMLRQ